MHDFVDSIVSNKLLSQILLFVLTTAAASLLVFVLLLLSGKLFQRLKTTKVKANFQFVEKMVRFIIIFLAVMWVVMSNDFTKSFGQSLFQSTAVIAAIAGFAAQSVLADLICGIMISSTKPFVDGDRIELENGIAGIVRDMTLRHVVLTGPDTQTFIIPNSKINAQYVRNMSYQTKRRSVDFRFSISYTADPEFASRVIRQAVMDSPYSVPGRVYQPGGETEYGKVYFIATRESSLEMETTGYYEPSTPTEVFKDDVNNRVFKALKENGIEIPYNYLNVMLERKDASSEAL